MNFEDLKLRKHLCTKSCLIFVLGCFSMWLMLHHSPANSVTGKSAFGALARALATVIKGKE